MNTLPNIYKLCHFNLPGKTKNNTKNSRPLTAAFSWTDCSKLSHIIVQRSLRPLFVGNFFAVFWQKIFYIFMGFYQKIMFELNMVNFNMYN